MAFNVAIDGPAGAGKSSIAKAAAAALGFIYVDTGALYRTVALAVTRSGNDVSDKDAVDSVLKQIQIELKFKNGVQKVYLNGEDVSDEIRQPHVSMAASAVSSIPSVRSFLFDLQKTMAADNDCIMDGRDIGTVVLPDAQVKIFLTASAEERARRRVKDLEQKGITEDFDKVLAEINQRDYNDTHRDIAPLKKAEDAVLADTSDIDLEKSVQLVLDIIKERM